jgi:hypothetical protein
MPSVSTLLAELETLLRATYPTITFGLGEKDLNRQDLPPPRVIWIPTTAKHATAEKQKTNPRRLMTREVTVVAHCWAADTANAPTPLTHMDRCEALVHTLLTALHKAGWGTGIRLGGEDWLQSLHVDFGHAAVVTFMPQVPVFGTTYATVQPTQLQPETSGSTQGDKQVDWNEP